MGAGEETRKTEVYRVKIAGALPLLMHNPAGMITDKPRRRRGEHPDPEAEAEQGLYIDAEGRICIPARNVKACIREAGRDFRVSGRRSTFAAMIRVGIKIEPDMIPLIHEGWKVDIRPVRLASSRGERILRARPRFDSWALEFKINYDPDMIHADTLKRILIDAGRYWGLETTGLMLGNSKLRSLSSNHANGTGHGPAWSGWAWPGLARHGGARLVA